jgi:hypothetical protein
MITPKSYARTDFTWTAGTDRSEPQFPRHALRNETRSFVESLGPSVVQIAVHHHFGTATRSSPFDKLCDECSADPAASCRHVDVDTPQYPIRHGLTARTRRCPITSDKANNIIVRFRDQDHRVTAAKETSEVVSTLADRPRWICEFVVHASVFGEQPRLQLNQPIDVSFLRPLNGYHATDPTSSRFVANRDHSTSQSADRPPIEVGNPSGSEYRKRVTLD